MTNEEKEAYKDAVIYLLQYARAMETDKNMSEYCLDIVEKARFLHNLKPHIFYGTGMNEEIEEKREFYSRDNRFNTKTE